MKPSPKATTPIRIMPCGPKRSTIQPSTGPEQGRLHRLHRGRAGQRRLAPAALVDQRREVRAEGLVEQRRLHELQAAARGDHSPAVEDFASQNRSPFVEMPDAVVVTAGSGGSDRPGFCRADGAPRRHRLPLGATGVSRSAVGAGGIVSHQLLIPTNRITPFNDAATSASAPTLRTQITSSQPTRLPQRRPPGRPWPRRGLQW